MSRESVDYDKIFVDTANKCAEVYESSVGMFENSQPQEMGLYELNKSIEEYNAKNMKLVFIRLYRAIYKNRGVVNLMGKIIDKIDVTDNKGITYNHSSINYKLNDDFMGLTIETKKRKMHLKPEHCENIDTNRYMSGVIAEESLFTVFGLPIEDFAYEHIKHILSSPEANENIKYSPFMLLPAALKTIFGDKKESSESSHPMGEERHSIFEKQHGFVCSTYVAYLIYMCSPRVKKYMDEHNLEPNGMSPSGLLMMHPDLTRLFDGYWTKYNSELNKFTKKKPDYKKYIEET